MTEQERKQRIKELKLELKELQAAPRSDWHRAFEALLRIKTHKYKGITIQSEVEIGADVPRTDYVILTEDEMQEFAESFFKIFRKTNILEYKNPHDALNERVIYKAAGYANLLIGTAEHEGDVPADQVTISLFRAVRNPELFDSWEKEGIIVRTDIPGIYRVIGITGLPFQIVITEELKDEAACRVLTDRADAEDIESVIEDANREEDGVVREFYRTYIEFIAEKNPEIFQAIRRDEDMKSALMEIMKDDVDERVRAQEQETLVTSIKNIMTNLKLTLDQAMDALCIPQGQRGKYKDLVGKSTQ